MPGIDFAAVRAQVSLPDVLQMLHFQPLRRRGHELRGCCPLCRSFDPRAFAARVGVRKLADGTRERVSRVSGETIPKP